VFDSRKTQKIFVFCKWFRQALRLALQYLKYLAPTASVKWPGHEENHWITSGRTPRWRYALAWVRYHFILRRSLWCMSWRIACSLFFVDYYHRYIICLIAWCRNIIYNFSFSNLQFLGKLHTTTSLSELTLLSRVLMRTRLLSSKIATSPYVLFTYKCTFLKIRGDR
jgi:hypothetical protein